MRSLHIIGSRQFGGAENFFLRLVTALKSDPRQDPLVVIRPRSPLRGPLEKAGFPPFFVPMRNGWDLFSMWQIRRLIREQKPRIVQTYMGRGTRLTRVPENSGAVHVARLGGYYKIDGYYRHADAWIGNTRGLCDYLVKQGLPARRVFPVGNFVPVSPAPTAEERTACRREIGLPEDAWALFTLGRLIAIKGFDDLLQAFSRMPEAIGGRPLYLVIGGDGPLRQNLVDLAQSLGVEQRVIWPGWLNDPDPYFHAADLFVCPSRVETLGNVILEAWAHGLPAVSTETPGGTELIETGENGLLTPLEDPESLAGTCTELLGQGAAVLDRLARKGRETLERHHTREAVIGAYREMYDQLVHRGD